MTPPRAQAPASRGVLAHAASAVDRSWPRIHGRQRSSTHRDARRSASDLFLRRAAPSSFRSCASASREALTSANSSSAASARARLRAAGGHSQAAGPSAALTPPHQRTLVCHVHDLQLIAPLLQRGLQLRELLLLLVQHGEAFVQVGFTLPRRLELLLHSLLALLRGADLLLALHHTLQRCCEVCSHLGALCARVVQRAVELTDHLAVPLHQAVPRLALHRGHRGGSRRRGGRAIKTQK